MWRNAAIPISKLLSAVIASEVPVIASASLCERAKQSGTCYVWIASPLRGSQ
jgi:hypothetical protein